MPGDVYCTLYPSREALEEMNRRLSETERQAAEQSAGRVPHPIETLLPPIADFLRDVEAHAKSLGPRLRIPDDVLDGTPESLDAVDKALKRIPWAKRPVPDLVTPLVAYLGEVIRKGTGGQWLNHSQKNKVALYDPDELLAQWAARRKLQPIAVAAAEKAAADAKARGASAHDVKVAYVLALRAIQEQLPVLKSYRIEVREENEPVIAASGGRLFQPFASVYLPMVEPSRRIPLRSSIGVPHDRPGAKPRPPA